MAEDTNEGNPQVDRSKKRDAKVAAEPIDLGSRPAEFVFSAKKSLGTLGLQALSNGGADIVANLKNYAGLDVEILQSRESLLSTSSTPAGTDGQTSKTTAVLVRIEEEKGKQFAQQSLQTNSPIWVDKNSSIYFGDFSPNFLFSTLQPAGIEGQQESIEIIILGRNDDPLEKAVISVYARQSLLPIVAKTDASGKATILIPSAFVSSIAALVVEPNSLHWSRVIRDPNIELNKPNKIRVRSYLDFNPRIQTEGAFSWGLSQLGILGQRELNGLGVKIGVIDSGCDNTHDLLQHVKNGIDFNPSSTKDSWAIDEIGHGTHCSGIIGAQGEYESNMMRGMAPSAEIHMYKVFPKGDFFVLGAAIEAAVRDKVDIISMSLGSKDFSNDISQNISLARDAGIPCFVAAGNSSDAVQFPANISSAIAVAALGNSNVFPRDSIQANTIRLPFLTAEGMFSPAFTCFGPSIDFVGPGVGIVSTIPGNSYKALDGTSMATPHLAGLAALYFQHNSSLRNAPRNSTRVDMLVDLLKRSAALLPFGVERVGSGLPIYSEQNNNIVAVSDYMSMQNHFGYMAGARYPFFIL